MDSADKGKGQSHKESPRLSMAEHDAAFEAAFALLPKIKSGDVAAYDRALTLLMPATEEIASQFSRGYARSKQASFLNEDDCISVACDAGLKVFESDTIGAEDFIAFKRYYITTILNRLKDFTALAKRRTKHNAYSLDEGKFGQHPRDSIPSGKCEDPYYELVAKETLEQIRRKLGSLRSPQLCMIEELAINPKATRHDLAKISGIQPNSVGVTLARARRAILEELQDPNENHRGPSR